MRNPFLRLAAILLTCSLVMDPVLAAGLSDRHPTGGHTALISSFRQNPFQEEALCESLVAGFHAVRSRIAYLIAKRVSEPLAAVGVGSSTLASDEAYLLGEDYYLRRPNRLNVWRWVVATLVPERWRGLPAPSDAGYDKALDRRVIEIFFVPLYVFEIRNLTFRPVRFAGEHRSEGLRSLRSRIRGAVTICASTWLSGVIAGGGLTTVSVRLASDGWRSDNGWVLMTLGTLAFVGALAAATGAAVAANIVSHFIYNLTHPNAPLDLGRFGGFGSFDSSSYRLQQERIAREEWERTHLALQPPWPPFEFRQVARQEDSGLHSIGQMMAGMSAAASSSDGYQPGQQIPPEILDALPFEPTEEQIHWVLQALLLFQQIVGRPPTSEEIQGLSGHLTEPFRPEYIGSWQALPSAFVRLANSVVMDGRQANPVTVRVDLSELSDALSQWPPWMDSSGPDLIVSQPAANIAAAAALALVAINPAQAGNHLKFLLEEGRITVRRESNMSIAIARDGPLFEGDDLRIVFTAAETSDAHIAEITRTGEPPVEPAAASAEAVSPAVAKREPVPLIAESMYHAGMTFDHNGHVYRLLHLGGYKFPYHWRTVEAAQTPQAKPYWKQGPVYESDEDIGLWAPIAAPEGSIQWPIALEYHSVFSRNGQYFETTGAKGSLVEIRPIDNFLEKKHVTWDELFLDYRFAFAMPSQAPEFQWPERFGDRFLRPEGGGYEKIVNGLPSYRLEAYDPVTGAWARISGDWYPIADVMAHYPGQSAPESNPHDGKKQHGFNGAMETGA